jgi:uncharacterized protein (DUF1330 family)
MSAFVVVQGTVTDPDKMQEYGAAAGPTIAAHGGELMVRGPMEVLSGSSDHKISVVVRFADAASARNWYNSPEYQALIPTREAAFDSVFALVGE